MAASWPAAPGCAAGAVSRTDASRRGVTDAARPAGGQTAVRSRRAARVTFVDASRTVRFPDSLAEPRPLVTVIRYPAIGPRSATSTSPECAAGARRGPVPADRVRARVCGDARSVRSAARGVGAAGYVVAAPIFPLGNANAPGGPNESDLVNQPRDMSFVITRDARSSTRRRTASSRASRSARDRRQPGSPTAARPRSRSPTTATSSTVASRAAVILSGAEIPGVGGFDFPAPSPPLLATQGTADTINQPRFTYAFFDAAPRPKYLLSLLGAQHLPPYTDRAAAARDRRAGDGRLLEQLPQTGTASAEHDALGGDCAGRSRDHRRPLIHARVGRHPEPAGHVRRAHRLHLHVRVVEQR